MNADRIWTLATVLVVGAVLVLGWFLGVSPFLSVAAAADAERETVEAVNAVEMARLDEMKAQHERIDELRVELADLRISLPGEADTDFVYRMLSGIQTESRAEVDAITTGQAVPYGAADGSTPTGDGSSSAAIPSLYSVPVTITFDQVPADRVLAFASLMQHSPRLFLVTSVTADGEGASTITAHMFVLYDENAPRGGAAQALSGVIPVPEPAPDEEPAPDGDPEPTPTPSP